VSLRWEDPPNIRRGQNQDWSAIAEALKLRPGEWAVIAVKDNPSAATWLAANIRRGSYPAFGTGFETVARKVHGESRVYARYVEETTP
jgi:hypothetical protein